MTNGAPHQENTVTSTGTNDIPKQLEAKLVEAKQWRDKRQEMIDASFPDAAAWNENVSQGVLLLAEIVDIIDETWGFA